MKTAASLPEVLANLKEIIEWSKINQSRIGYFASLYRKMTVAVQKGITEGVFENGLRMELLDVTFANRYIQAWHAYVAGKPCSSAWCTAFDACGNDKLIVLQQLLLGINTHINLDLAIAAAEACPGDKIYDLQNDFEKINDIISNLTQEVQETLCKIWFPLRMLASISNGRHEPVLNFSISAARKASWANAIALAVTKGDGREAYILGVDKAVVEIGERVINPGFAASLVTRTIKKMEDRSVTRIIGILND